MNENNTKKPFPKKAVVIISIVALLSVLAAAAGVTVFFLLNKDKNPDVSLENNNDTNNTSEINSDITPDDSVSVSNLSAAKIEITPTRNTPEGIEVDTEFIVRTDSPVKIAELGKSITIKSGESYKLSESGTECEYIMSLDSPLKYDSVYKIEYMNADNRPVSFAFQTVENLKVTGSTPGNESSGVPLNNGIEVTFNETIEGDFKDYFAINPYVTGKFDNVGNTYIFIPDGLMPGTTYEVTIKKGLKSAESEKILEEDYNFSFWTQWDDSVDFVNISGNVYETFLSDDEIFVELSARGVFLEKSYNIEIYELKTPEDFLNAEIVLNFPEALSELTRVGSLETELLSIEINNYYNVNYIMLNQKLPGGWYIIKINTQDNGKNFDLYKFIQVSPLSVYSATIDGEMLFWINDATTGLPAVGAQIMLETDHGATATDSDGVATITIIDNEKNTSVRIKYKDYPEFVYITSSRAPAVLETRSRYYNYIYTDRKAYRPNDTIDVFGVIRERYEEYKITAGDKITLEIGDMIKIPVVLDKYGSFNVKIPIKDLKGYLDICLCFNGEIIGSSYINIVDYDNAKYIVEASSDRYTYRPGESVNIEISAEFYDGTAVEGLEVMRSDELAAMTDSEGGANVTEYVQKNSWISNWQPYTSSFYYNIGKTENRIQYLYVPYLIMPSDIMLEDEIISKTEIAFNSSFIDRDAIEKHVEESWYNAYSLQPDLYRGSSVDINFTVDIYKREIIQTKIRERYDYINKINVPVYEYRTEETIVGTHNLSTANGKVLLSGLPESDDIYINYYAIVKYNDTEGNNIEFTVWYGGYGWYYYNQSSIKYYYFGVYNKKDENIYSLRLNETGYVKLQEYSDSTQVTEGKILALMCHGKNKIISKNIGSPDGTPVTFTEDCVFNVQVVGAYFDGKYIYPMNYGPNINYDFTEKTLDFDVSFDKDSYVPGEEVTAEIKITDENGNPKKTLVNISVVDESVFADYDNNANMPSNYYNSIYNYINYSYYASYTQHEFLNSGGGAEMGGGGGDDYSVRKDFTDNPAFISAETDDNGVAEISFKLAEKITSWRVTVHGITEDNYVGNTKKNIISSLPFAIDLVMNNEYIAGDDAAVIVKPQGTQYKYNQTEATYNVEILNGENVIFSETKTSKSGAIAFNAGKLPEGDYTVRVAAELGDLRDAMEKEFSVIKSGVLLPLTARELISEESPALRGFEIKTSPVRVTISNYDMGFIMRTLYSCVNYTSKRTDYIAANVFSRRFTESIYDKEPLSISYSDYYASGVNFSNGVSELLYGSEDLLYTARFYACFPESIMDYNKKWLRDYVYNIGGLYNGNIKSLKAMTPEFDDEYLELNRAAGYLTLAAIGDSVLLDIYEQVKIIYNSENQDKFTESYQSYMRVLYYAAALCAIGDDNSAAELLGRYTVSGELYAPDQATNDMQKEYMNTIMLYINTRLDPDAVYGYLKDAIEKDNLTNKYISDVCEKINFVRYFTFKGGTRSEIEYTLDGVTKQAVFENYDMTELIITKEQFEDLNIRQISGNTAVNLYFYGLPENLDADKNKINIDKRILNRDEYLKEFGNSRNADESAYYIVLKVKLPEGGYYSIRDRLPGNMRYLNSNDNNYSNDYYVRNPEKQFIDIDVYTKNGGEITVVYNAVRISDADAVTEKAYISRYFDIDDIWGASK
ncbi:MAG: Ig-like domain-containing protein [Oscillospiraceae bacterium]|nr:Ig-like domain-containing protein [Oscillospiraceae bacterium]